MKIKSMQQGGGLIYTPFIPEQYAGTSSKSSSSSSEDDPKLDPLDKELIALMKDQNLLPSDVKNIFSALTTFQRRSQSLSSTAGFGGTGSYRSVMPGMLQIMNMVSQAKFNKTQWDKAISEIEKHDAGSEIAMDSSGKMYVATEKGINLIKPTEFDPEKHQPLSNSQLLRLRERSYAFNDNMLNDLSDVIGMDDIQKQVSSIIKDFGTIKEAKFQQKKMQEIAQDLNSPDGIYKVTQKYSKADLTDFSGLLFSQLSKNAQHLINANAAVGGYKPADYIRSIIASNTSREMDIDYDATASKAAGFDTDPNKTKSESLTQNNYLQRVGSLRGDRTIVSIAPRGSKISDTAALSAHAFTFGTVIDRSNKPIEKMSLSDLMKNGWAFAAGEPNDITFGNKLLKDWERDAIMFDDNSNLTAVMLPYKNQGGHIVPDFQLLETFNKVQSIIQEHQNLSKTELSNILVNYGISPSDINYDIDTNTISLKNTMAFLTVSAYAGDDTIDLSKDDKRYLEKIDKSDGQHIKDYYNNMVKFGKLRPAKKGNFSIKGYSKSESNDFWKGNVFVPMKNAFNAMNLSGIGEYVPKSEEADFYERVAAKEQENALQQYAKENDPNYTKNTQLGQFRYE